MSGFEITDGWVRVREPPSAQEGLYGSLVALNPPHKSESHRVARPIQPSICRMSCRRGLEVMFRCAGAAKPAIRRSYSRAFIAHSSGAGAARGILTIAKLMRVQQVSHTRFIYQSPWLKLVTRLSSDGWRTRSVELRMYVCTSRRAPLSRQLPG